jgi:hypothetical protein
MRVGNVHRESVNRKAGGIKDEQPYNPRGRVLAWTAGMELEGTVPRALLTRPSNNRERGHARTS